MITYRKMKLYEAESIMQIDAVNYIKCAWRMNQNSKEYELDK